MDFFVKEQRRNDIVMIVVPKVPDIIKETKKLGKYIFISQSSTILARYTFPSDV